MTTALDLLNQLGKKDILLTVSPVPIEATFTTHNAVIANSYSKSVLRVAAEILTKSFDNVDYFPSYEIVLSQGSHAFEDDNVHVRGEIATDVTRYMIKNYGQIGSDPVLSSGEFYKKAMEMGTGPESLQDMRALADRLIKFYPQQWLGFDAMGHYHSRSGNYLAALEATRAALAMEPNHWGLLARVATLQEELGDLKQAKLHFGQAAAAFGEQPMPDWFKACLNRHQLDK